MFGINPDDSLAQRGWLVWVYDEFGKLDAANAIDSYLATAKPDAAKQQALATADGRSQGAWPGFDAWYNGLDTPIERDQAVYYLRTRLRAKLAPINPAIKTGG